MALLLGTNRSRSPNAFITAFLEHREHVKGLEIIKNSGGKPAHETNCNPRRVVALKLRFQSLTSLDIMDWSLVQHGELMIANEGVTRWTGKILATWGRKLEKEKLGLCKCAVKLYGPLQNPVNGSIEDQIARLVLPSKLDEEEVRRAESLIKKKKSRVGQRSRCPSAILESKVSAQNLNIE